MAGVEPPGHLILGRRGEDEAETAYRRLGCRVLARNWRPAKSGGALRGLEIDLICERGSGSGAELIFVEVKARAGCGQRAPLGEPGEWLSPVKLERLARAVGAYLNETGQWERPCRVDLAAVTFHDASGGGLNPPPPTVERFENVLQLDHAAAAHAAVRKRRGRGSVGGVHADWQPW